MNIKVVSFNIRFKDDADGYSIPERAVRLKKILDKYSPDIIGFQEYTPAWDEIIRKEMGDTYEIYNQYRNDPEGTPILWRKDKFQCLKKGHFWLSDTPEEVSAGWDNHCRCSRICVYGIFRDIETGKNFTYMNTHFGFGDECQTKSANLIYNYSGKISSYPTFVTGDFNMIPESLGYKEMVKHFTDVNAVTVNDRRDTYHGYDPEKEWNQHIDYCFISKGIIPELFKIMEDAMEGKYPSDHFGIYMELKI